MQSPEVDLLKEIARLKQLVASFEDEKKKKELERQIQEKQIEFNMMMERRKRKS